MASLNSICYNILNIYRSGISSDDDSVSLRQIAFWIGYYRALFIKREIENRKKLNRKYFQDLGCLELEKVDAAECCDVEWGCTVVRTVRTIPNILQLGYFGLVDKKTPIPFTTSIQSQWASNNKYTSNLKRAYWNNDRIYIVNADRLKFVDLQAIFSDPLAAADFVDCDDKPCFTWDSEYPLPEDMIAQITDMTLSKEGRLIFNTPNDQTNDGPKEQPKGSSR